MTDMESYLIIEGVLSPGSECS